MADTTSKLIPARATPGATRPNANGILSCRDCGEYTHVRHANAGRCPECDDAARLDASADDDSECAPSVTLARRQAG